jgi:hypothetical protein
MIVSSEITRCVQNLLKVDEREGERKKERKNKRAEETHPPASRD